MNKLIGLLQSERPAHPETMYDIGYNNGLTMAIAIVGKREWKEVVHAHWVWDPKRSPDPWCSACVTSSCTKHLYCHHCGAKMDGRKADV